MSAPRSELKGIGYEIFIGALSLLSIFNLFLVVLTRQDEDLQNVLLIMNAIFSGVFLLDFSYRLATAPSRRGYFFRHFGWADLLASLPFPSSSSCASSASSASSGSCARSVAARCCGR